MKQAKHIHKFDRHSGYCSCGAFKACLIQNGPRVLRDWETRSPAENRRINDAVAK